MRIQAERNPTKAFEPHRAAADQIQVSAEQHAASFAKVNERNASAFKPLAPTYGEMSAKLEAVQDSLAHWTRARESAAASKAGLDSALDEVSDTLAEEEGLTRADRQALNEKAKRLGWRIANEEKRIKAADAGIARYKAELKEFDAPLLKRLEAERQRRLRVSAVLAAAK